MDIAFMFFLMIIVALLVPILVGIYVYRDAKTRNMDALLWTLVSMLIPGLLGLIIYLIIRNNYTNQGSVNRINFIISDRRLVQMLIVVAVSFILLLTLYMATSTYFITTGTSSSEVSQSGIIIEDEEHLPIDVTNWINQCDDKGPGVYVLKLSPGKLAQTKFLSGQTGDELEDMYFFYVNQYKGLNLKKAFIGGPEVQESTLKVSYKTVNKTGEERLDYELSAIRIYGTQVDNVKFIIDGEGVEFFFSEL